MICAANWKMNINLKEAQDFLVRFKERVREGEKKDFIFFVPALLSFLFYKQDWKWGGQNGNFERRGAFTGENSLEVFKDLGAQFCLLGHSERRQFFNESSYDIEKKFNLMKELKIKPVLCIGEKKEERGAKEKILTEQLQSFKNEKDFLISYEPVWSIGTGKTPSSQEVNETLAWIKDFMTSPVPVLYGGSVNKKTVKSFSNQKGIDGFLIGGSSLNPDDLYDIYLEVQTS